MQGWQACIPCAQDAGSQKGVRLMGLPQSLGTEAYRAISKRKPQ
jgi:hypothetical protein